VLIYWRIYFPKQTAALLSCTVGRRVGRSKQIGGPLTAIDNIQRDILKGTVCGVHDTRFTRTIRARANMHFVEYSRVRETLWTRGKRRHEKNERNHDDEPLWNTFALYRRFYEGTSYETAAWRAYIYIYKPLRNGHTRTPFRAVFMLRAPDVQCTKGDVHGLVFIREHIHTYIYIYIAAMRLLRSEITNRTSSGRVIG